MLEGARLEKPVRVFVRSSISAVFSSIPDMKAISIVENWLIVEICMATVKS